MKPTTMLAALLTVIPLPAFAQMVKTYVTASNGVVISRNYDEFSGRTEYTAPTIDIKTNYGEGNGAIFVGKVKQNGILGKLLISGFVLYSGNWQLFNSAVFRGGESVDYTRTGGSVGSCRYGCTLTEDFVVNFTQDQIKRHAENGILSIQISASKSGNKIVVDIPINYIDAINEVAK